MPLADDEPLPVSIGADAAGRVICETAGLFMPLVIWINAGVAGKCPFGTHGPCASNFGKRIVAMHYSRRMLIKSIGLGVLAAGAGALHSPAYAASAQEINRDADIALTRLYNSRQDAQILGREAKGILVFPRIVKAGLVVGGAYGEGVLRKAGKPVAYYKSVAGSYGLQVGAQAFGYALFLMSDSAVRYLDTSKGWEIGVGPSVVVVDEGVGRKITTTTLRDEVYAFIFNQTGLMAGLGIEGTKISKIVR